MLTSFQDPKEWATYILKESMRRKNKGDIRPQQFLRIQTMLEPLLKTPEAREDKFFPPHPKRAPYAPQASWRTNILAAHRDVPFAAIVTDDKLGTVAPDEVDLEDPAFLLASVTRVTRDAPSLVNLLDSLLSVSGKLALIDPHFQPREKRYQALLPEILKRHTHFQSTNIYIKEDYSKSCTSHDFSDWIDSSNPRESLLPPGKSIRTTILRQRRAGEKLHARYILTEVGGFLVDPGLDVYTHSGSGNTFIVTRLTAKLHRELLQEYVQLLGFQAVKEFVVSN